MEVTNKWKADEDQQGQPEKKSKNEQEEREAKSTDEWETYTRDLKAGAERRVEEDKKAKVGEDLENYAMMEVVLAMGFNESDLKYDEAVEKFINQSSEETFGEFFGAISRAVLDGELIKKAREAEKETFKKHGVCETVPLEECGRSLGRHP